MHCQRITLAVPQMACQPQRSAVEPHRESNRPGVVFWLLQKLGPGTWVQFIFQFLGMIGGDTFWFSIFWLWPSFGICIVVIMCICLVYM